jgi:hypothetical protein
MRADSDEASLWGEGTDRVAFVDDGVVVDGPARAGHRQSSARADAPVLRARPRARGGQAADVPDRARAARTPRPRGTSAPSASEPFTGAGAC